MGKILLSFAVLMAGASINKMLLVFRHMGLHAYTARTFFRYQRSCLFPTVLHYWETYRMKLVEKLKGMKDVAWSGDGCFDSIEHSAKYGVYTMFCTTLMKIIHFELVQVSVHVGLKVIKVALRSAKCHSVLFLELCMPACEVNLTSCIFF